jgi:hypothetical protein
MMKKRKKTVTSHDTPSYFSFMMQSLQRFIKVVAQPSYYILRTLPRYHTVHRLPYTPWHKPVPWTVTSIRYSTFQATPLDQHTYHRTSDETLDYILEYLEEVFDDMAVLDYILNYPMVY